jgi:hypothetical protein
VAQLNRALCCFEQGKVEQARDLLQQLLKYDPETEFRPAVAFYLASATGPPVALEGPSQQIPIWSGMFAPDGETGSPERRQERDVPEPNDSSGPATDAGRRAP